MKSKLVFFPFVFVVILSSCVKNAQDKFSVFKGPYLGQTPPRAEPELFMPGIISTNDVDGCIAFLQNAKLCVFTRGERGTYFMFEKNGVWTSPKKAPFQNMRDLTDYTAAPDGRTLVFQSSRPTTPNDSTRDSNIWAVEWTGSSWTEPYLLPSPPNSEYGEGYPSVTSDGTVYFFTGSRSDSRLGDIYRCKCINGEYQEAERLEEPINTDYHDVDPYVAPDESYLLLGSGRPGGFGTFDTYICFRREDGSWTHPINIGVKLNSHSYAIRICVTPDGKYFFFTSGCGTDIPKGKEVKSPLVDRYGDSDVFWVDTGFINDLKKILLNRESVAEVIEREYQENGLLSATDKLKEFYSTEQDCFYFSIYELLAICEHMIEAEQIGDAEKFYRALLDILPKNFRIKRGYMQVCTLNGLVAKGMALLKTLWSEYPSFKSEQTMNFFSYNLLENSKIEDALEILHFNIREFPNSHNAFLSLSEAYLRYGDTEKAIKYCKKSLELKPDFDFAVELLKSLKKR